MALSYCNWSENSVAAIATAVNAYSPLFQPLAPAPEIYSFHEESTFYDAGVNPIFGYCNYSDHVLTPAGNLFTPSPEFQDPCYSLPYSGSLNQEQLFPVEYGMVAEMGDGAALPAWYGGGGGNGDGGVEVKRGGSLSAQSMAARVRRKKISEKTSELGKLVPGGHKMNTAEMFQAAFKYIKFLQAQIGVLKLMPSLPESEEVLSNGEMQALVTCTLMQEKLYTEEKCIVPNTLQEPSN